MNAALYAIPPTTTDKLRLLLIEMRIDISIYLVASHTQNNENLLYSKLQANNNHRYRVSRTAQ